MDNMDGVLLMAYGTPRSIGGIERYYTDIMGGTKPSGEQLDKLVGRYKAIGGASPLYDITEEQARRLQRLLDPEKSRIKVYFGMKHAAPFIKDTVSRMPEEKIGRLVCIALAPHYSITGIGSYISKVRDANAALGNAIEIKCVESWHLNKWLIKFWSESINKARAGMEKAFVVFSAHSLPEAVEEKGPYKKQLLETAAEVAKKAHIDDWALAFQSQSGRGEKWYGPTIMELIKSNAESKREFVIAPIGFVSDNLEILYDLDIMCVEWASENGLWIKRAEMPNASTDLINAIGDVVKNNI